MAPEGKPFHVDCVVSMESNVHIATHRDWFTTLTDFKTELNSGAEALGIGDVELDMVTSSSKDSTTHGKILLRDVLFIPTFLTNIVGNCILGDYNCEMLGTPAGLIDKATWQSAGLLCERIVFRKLWVVGQYEDTTVLDPAMHKQIQVFAHWSGSERARWELAREMLKMVEFIRGTGITEEQERFGRDDHDECDGGGDDGGHDGVEDGQDDECDGGDDGDEQR